MSVNVLRDNDIVTVVLDRAHARNAVDGATAQRLADAFRAFDEDPTARVAVLHGDHGTFCAGADLKAITRGEGNRLDPEGDGPMGPSRMVLSKPVIASIAGYAVAGGLELALWCDMRVADEDAVLGVFCRRWGVPLIDGGTARLPRVVGLGRALDLILTGRAVDAAEALSMGLVNRVVPRGESLAAAQSLARELSRLPQACLRADRASAYAGLDVDLATALRQEFAGGVAVLGEGVEGAMRFAAGEGRHGAPTRR